MCSRFLIYLNVYFYLWPPFIFTYRFRFVFPKSVSWDVCTQYFIHDSSSVHFAFPCWAETGCGSIFLYCCCFHIFFFILSIVDDSLCNGKIAKRKLKCQSRKRAGELNKKICVCIKRTNSFSFAVPHISNPNQQKETCLKSCRQLNLHMIYFRRAFTTFFFFSFENWKRL